MLIGGIDRMKRIIKKISGLIFVLALITVWALYNYDGTATLTNASALNNQKICQNYVSDCLTLYHGILPHGR